MFTWRVVWPRLASGAVGRLVGRSAGWLVGGASGVFPFSPRVADRRCDVVSAGCPPPPSPTPAEHARLSSSFVVYCRVVCVQLAFLGCRPLVRRLFTRRQNDSFFSLTPRAVCLCLFGVSLRCTVSFIVTLPKTKPNTSKS